MALSDKQRLLKKESKYSEQRKKWEAEMDPVFVMDNSDWPTPPGITRAVWREHVFGVRKPPHVPHPGQLTLRMYIGRQKLTCYVYRPRAGLVVQVSTIDEELGPYRATRSIQAIELMTEILMQKLEERCPESKDIILTRFSFQNDKVRAAAPQKIQIVLDMLFDKGFRIGGDVDDFIVSNKLRKQRLFVENFLERYYLGGCHTILGNFKVAKPHLILRAERFSAAEEFENDSAEQIGSALLSSMEFTPLDSFIDSWDQEEADLHELVVAARQEEEEADEDGWLMDQRRSEFDDDDDFDGYDDEDDDEGDDYNEDEDEEDEEPIDVREFEIQAEEFSQIKLEDESVEENEEPIFELVDEEDDTKIGDDISSFFADDEDGTAEEPSDYPPTSSSSH